MVTKHDMGKITNNKGLFNFIPVQSSSFRVKELVAAMPNNNMDSNRFAEAEVW